MTPRLAAREQSPFALPIPHSLGKIEKWRNSDVIRPRRKFHVIPAFLGHGMIVQPVFHLVLHMPGFFRGKPIANKLSDTVHGPINVATAVLGQESPEVS